MAVTIFDVAKRAGVSKTTVSAVLCGKDGVKQATRERVMQAISDLHYFPNFNARNFVQKKTNILGALILSDPRGYANYNFENKTGTFTNDVINGIISSLVDTNYGLVTEYYYPVTEELPKIIRDSRVDGLFIIGSLSRHKDVIEALRDRNIPVPVVLIGDQSDEYDAIQVDVERSIYIAAEHLLKRGKRKIGLLNCPDWYPSNLVRSTGYLRALADFGVEANEVFIINSPSNSGKGGYNAAQTLFSRTVPDAIIGANVSITMGALRFLYEKRLHVPDDISIVGYEDSVFYAFTSPAITAVDIRKELTGERAASIMFGRINNELRSPPVAEFISPVLVERDSV